jgi:hypothetical protein
MDVPGWRRRRRRGVRGWSRRSQLEGGLQGGNLFRLLLAEPIAMLREFPFEGLVKAGLLCGEILPKLLQSILHVVCK